MNPLGLKQMAIAAVVALVVGFGAGWAVQGWRLGMQLAEEKEHFTGELKKISDAATAAAQEHQRKQAEWQDTVAELDRKHFEEMTNAKTTIDKLRLDLRAGAMRVFIPAKCPADPGRGSEAPGAAGVGDGAARAELDPKAAADLAGIAADGDRAIRKMTALQQYVRMVCLN